MRVVLTPTSPRFGAALARAMRPAAWSDDRDAALIMVAWFSQKITVGLSPWATLFDREKRDGVWAYRRKTELQAAMALRPAFAGLVDSGTILTKACNRRGVGRFATWSMPSRRWQERE